jgi:hypothetical protein
MILFGAEEFALVAQVGQKVTVAGNIRVEPPQLADQRAFSLFVFWIESQNLGVEQIIEVQLCQPRAILRRGAVRVKSAAPFRLLARHVRPANVLCVGEDAGLDGLVFSGAGHESYSTGSSRLINGS